MIKVQRFAMIAFLCALPLIYNPGGGHDMRIFQERVFQVVAMGLVSLFIGNIWMSLFMIWSLILFVLNGGNIGMDYVFNIFLGILLFKMARSYYTKFRFLEDSRFIIWLLVINIGFIVLQLLGIDPMHSAKSGNGIVDQFADFRDPVGIFGIKCINGIFMALCIPIVATISVWLALLVFIPIYLCQSTAAILAGVVALMSYLYMTKTRLPIKIPFFNILLSFSWFKLLLIPMVLGAISYAWLADFKVDPKMFNSRFGVWHAAVKTSLARPIGYGPDSWRNITKHKNFLFAGDQDRRSAIATNLSGEEYAFTYYHPNMATMKKMNEDAKVTPPPNFSPNFWDNAHNQYVTLLFMFGLPGVAIFICFVRDMFKRFRRTVISKELALLTSLLLAFAVASTTQFPLELARIGYLFPLVLGAWFAVTERPIDVADD